MPIDKTPEKNAVLLVWFNRYAGILFKTPSKTLVIDPVDVKPKKLQNTDAILITMNIRSSGSTVDCRNSKEHRLPNNRGRN